MNERQRRWTRHDDHGKWSAMAVAGGYVMARRPGCSPVVFSVKEWDAMRREP